MTDLGKVLIAMGALIIVIGVVLLVSGKMNLPFGRLPGDISWRSKSGNTQFYFPLATSILLSIVLTLIFWVIGQFRK